MAECSLASNEKEDATVVWKSSIRPRLTQYQIECVRACVDCALLVCTPVTLMEAETQSKKSGLVCSRGLVLQLECSLDACKPTDGDFLCLTLATLTSFITVGITSCVRACFCVFEKCKA